MQEEIFGPVMPVLTFDSIEEVIRKVNSMAHPLALYIFAQEKAICEKVTSEVWLRRWLYQRCDHSPRHQRNAIRRLR